MALGAITVLDSGGYSGAGLTTKTCNIDTTPTPGAMLTFVATAHRVTTGGAAPVLSIGSTHGGTWAWQTIQLTDIDSIRDTLVVCQAQVPAGAGIGRFSILSNLNCGRYVWLCWERTGAVLGFNANQITNFRVDGFTGATLPNAPAASSEVLAVIAGVGDDNGFGPGTGFVEIAKNFATSTSLHGQQDAAPADAGFNWTGGGGPENLVIGWEEVAAAEPSASGGVMTTSIGV